MRLIVILAVTFTAAAVPASAQTNTGRAPTPPTFPRPSTFSTIKNTDVPFRGGLSDTRTSPFANHADQTSCLERKSDGRTICHTRAEWEKIAKELAPAR